MSAIPPHDKRDSADASTDWNFNPGAVVDTLVPTYQLTAPESWQTWNWKQRFPGRDTLKGYFEHLDQVWNLNKDVAYNTSVTSMKSVSHAISTAVIDGCSLVCRPVYRIRLEEIRSVVQEV